MGEKGKAVKKINKTTSSRPNTKTGPAPEIENAAEITSKKTISDAKTKKLMPTKNQKSSNDNNEKSNIFVVVSPSKLQLEKEPTSVDTDDNNNSSGSSEKSDMKAPQIPEVLKKQGTASYCSNAENTCPCNTMEDVEQISKEINYCNRKTWITVDRLNELRKKAQEAMKTHKTFTIRGCFFSVRNALVARGWVEKLDAHRKHQQIIFQVSYEDITQTLPKRRPGESRRQYLIKCERNIMSRFLDHMPIDFLWSARKEKCDWIDQAKNPLMIINKFHRVPFTTKEGLCTQLRDFHWFYEEGMAELYFPRCYNVWSPEELNEFTENFRVTGCISFLKWMVETLKQQGYDAVFAPTGKVPLTAIDFATKRCIDYLESSNHNDIDNEESIRVWDHDWDAFLTQHYILTHENARIQVEPTRIVDPIIKSAEKLLKNMQEFWPQYGLDGYLNVWIVKPANKCRGRGIHLMNNLRKIINMVNPSIATKSRYVVQKYVERPLIIHNTKFDIRQWFLVTSVQPLIVWMYKESYLRFSSQEYDLQNYHESVHLTNHAVQKKYRNARRDNRLPRENMWDCYTFQAYLRQIGEQEMWDERIYPGMRKAIVGAMLASQENMDRRSNTFELFGADFLISEDFYPWLIEINSSPDLGGTTSVTARMCPQCLEDVIKVVIDRKNDPKADTGNFELIYRQLIPPTPAYMGLNLFLKGRQLTPRVNGMRREKTSTGFQYPKPLQSINLSHCSSTLSVPSQMSTSPFQNGFLGERGNHPGPIIVDLFEGSAKDNSTNDLVFNNNRIPNSPTPAGYMFRSNTVHTLGCSRLLTPLIPSHRSSEQQNVVSPRLPSSRRPSKESGWKQPFDMKQKPPLAQNPSRRHISCGPKVLVADEATESVQETSDSAGILPDNKFQCVGNKCSSDNLNITENDTAIRSPPRTASLASRRQIFELLYKSKSAKIQRTTTKSPAVKPKSSPNTLLGSGNRRNYSNSVKNINGNKIQKSTNVKNSNVDCPSSPFRTVGTSLRAWRSRNYKTFNNIGQHQQTGLVACKSAPVTSPKACSPRRQLCKNLSKKLSGQLTCRGNTRC